MKVKFYKTKLINSWWERLKEKQIPFVRNKKAFFRSYKTLKDKRILQNSKFGKFQTKQKFLQKYNLPKLTKERKKSEIEIII